MFTKEEIDKLRLEYIKYTSFIIPEIDEVVYENTDRFYGEINYNEISLGKYIIHLSNSLNSCPIDFQKSVVYHEFTHIYDYISLKSLSKSQIDSIMHTYSEAHAETIKLRYLLKLDMKCKINQGTRYIEDSEGKNDTGTVTSRYLNQSLTSYFLLLKEKLPKHFYNFLHSYCHFCGYMTIRIPKEAIIIIDGILEKFPSQYRDDLKELYYAIEKKDFQKCCEIHDRLQLDAFKITIEN